MQKICRPSPRSSAKREAILDASSDLFCEQGYASTSMDQVAARAGVSKATIYAHFQGKEDLFAAIIRRRCDSELSFARFKDLDVADARTALTAIATHLMRLLLSPDALGIYRVVVAESLRQPDLARAYYEAGPLRGKTNMIAVFEDLTRRGELAVGDAWRAADQFIGMLRGEYYNRALLGMPQAEGRSLDDTIMQAVEAFLKIYRP